MCVHTWPCLSTHVHTSTHCQPWLQVWWQAPKGSSRLFTVPKPFSFQQQQEQQGYDVGYSRQQQQQQQQQEEEEEEYEDLHA